MELFSYLHFQMKLKGKRWDFTDLLTKFMQSNGLLPLFEEITTTQSAAE